MMGHLILQAPAVSLEEISGHSFKSTQVPGDSDKSCLGIRPLFAHAGHWSKPCARTRLLRSSNRREGGGRREKRMPSFPFHRLYGTVVWGCYAILPPSPQHRAGFGARLVPRQCDSSTRLLCTPQPPFHAWDPRPALRQ